MVLVHELGHLAGYGHPDEDQHDSGFPDPPADRTDIMRSRHGAWGPCFDAFWPQPEPLTRAAAVRAVRRVVPPERRVGIVCRPDESLTEWWCLTRRRRYPSLTYAVIDSGESRPVVIRLEELIG